jgi:hypothetical protein
MNFGPSMLNVTCRCGHNADADEFFHTRLGVELPRGQFQCRKCGHAWKIVAKTPAKVMPSGFVMPGERGIVECDPLL